MRSKNYTGPVLNHDTWVHFTEEEKKTELPSTLHFDILNGCEPLVVTYTDKDKMQRTLIAHISAFRKDLEAELKKIAAKASPDSLRVVMFNSYPDSSRIKDVAQHLKINKESIVQYTDNAPIVFLESCIVEFDGGDKKYQMFEPTRYFKDKLSQEKKEGIKKTSVEGDDSASSCVPSGFDT